MVDFKLNRLVSLKFPTAYGIMYNTTARQKIKTSNVHSQNIYFTVLKKKYLVLHSHNFLLPYITLEESI